MPRTFSAYQDATVGLVPEKRVVIAVIADAFDLPCLPEVCNSVKFFHAGEVGVGMEYVRSNDCYVRYR